MRKIKTAKCYEFSHNEMDEILLTINQYIGFDMSGYSKPSFRRRFIRLLELKKMSSLFGLKHALINNEMSAQELVNELTVNVTEAFRDPSFFASLKENVFPYLATFPHIKIWHAGCSLGEEMYSLAIMLNEAGLLNRCQLYGTDINSDMLEIARKGIYQMKNVQEAFGGYS